MAGAVTAADDPRGLAALLRSYEQRLNRLETQVRGQNMAVDAPGAVQFKDEQGRVRFRIGLDDMGGVGYSGFDANGTLRLRLGQNVDGDVVYEGFEADGSVRFRLGEDAGGGIGYVGFDPSGNRLAAAEQAVGTDPRVISSTSYVDAGPPMSATVTAGPSGQLLVVMTAVVNATDRTVTSSGFMSFASTGGRVTDALDVNALQVSEPLVDVQTENANVGHTHDQVGETVAGAEHFHLMYPAMGPPAARPFRGSRVVLLNGCDPNVPVVVTAKYRVSAFGGPYLFDDRSLIVVPL